MVRLRDEGKIDRIFDAALKLVLSQGYTGLKMPDVAHRAGLASGTLYIYFKNKKDLINQLYLKLKYEEATLLMAPYRPGAGFLDNFRSLWYGNIHAAIQSPERTEFLVQFLESEYLSPRTRRVSDELLDPLREFLLDGQKRGIIRRADVDVQISFLLGSAGQLIRLIKKKKTGRKKVIDECYQMSLSGISV